MRSPAQQETQSDRYTDPNRKRKINNKYISIYILVCCSAASYFNSFVSLFLPPSDINYLFFAPSMPMAVFKWILWLFLFSNLLPVHANMPSPPPHASVLLYIGPFACSHRAPAFWPCSLLIVSPSRSCCSSASPSGYAKHQTPKPKSCQDVEFACGLDFFFVFSLCISQFAYEDNEFGEN